VGSPIITGDATCAIVMNLPSMMKFEKSLVPGGKLLINASLVDQEPERQDIEVYRIAANELANKVGNPRVANMVMLGAYLELTNLLPEKSVVEAMKKVYGPGKEAFIPLNRQAMEEGAAALKQEAK